MADRRSTGRRRFEWFDQTGFVDGFRANAPLILPAMPFGFVLGVAISESDVVSNLAGWASCIILFAGSAQLAAVGALDDGAGVIVTVLAVWMINARHIMYSAALADRYDEIPRPVRLLGSYVLMDQAFAVTDPLDASRPSAYRMSFLLGSGAFAWIFWQGYVIGGILLGDVLPSSWSLDFAVPLMFLGLMVMAINNRPGVIAAVVGGLVAVIGADWGSGLGLLIGVIAGMVAGGLAETFQPKSPQDSIRVQADS